MFLDQNICLLIINADIFRSAAIFILFFLALKWQNLAWLTKDLNSASQNPFENMFTNFFSKMLPAS